MALWASTAVPTRTNPRLPPISSLRAALIMASSSATSTRTLRGPAFISSCAFANSACWPSSFKLPAPSNHHSRVWRLVQVRQASALGLDQAELHSPDNSLHPVVHFELGNQVSHVASGGAVLDPKSRRQSVVVQALRHQSENLALTARQGLHKMC